MVYYLLEDFPVRPEQFYRSTNPSFWNYELEKEFAMIAMAAYPFEACAYVIDQKLVPVENISKNPREEFELSTADSLLYTKAKGFIHSHPDGPFHPSATDMRSQKATKIPFGLMTVTKDSASVTIWMHDKNLSLPLEDRPFIHGISDCYSAVRSHKFQTSGIVLPDFPRDYEWWEATAERPADNLYLENFGKAGYSIISSNEEMIESDVILMNIQTNIVSHAAVYLGNNLIYHHLRDRISRKDHATTWKKFFHTVVRYG